MAGKIAFIYNWVPTAERRGVFSECTTKRTIAAVEEALSLGGYETLSINLRSRKQLEQCFRRWRPDFAFVIAEGFLDSPATLYDGTGAALVRKTLAEMGIPSSHSPAEAMELCRHKELTYAVLSRTGVSIPHRSRPPMIARLLQREMTIPAVLNRRRRQQRRHRFRFGGGIACCTGGRMEELYDLLGPIGLVAEEYLPGLNTR